MIRGSLVALVTPMTPTGDVDWDALAALIEWHIECRTDGIVSVGTTGESPTVDFAEHKRIMEFTVERAKKRIPVGPGTMPTHGPLFVAILIASVLLIGLLNYVPALALGPVVEHLMLHAG